MPCLCRAAPLTDPIQILQLWQSIKILGDDLRAPHQQKTLNKNSNENNKKTQLMICCFINFN